MIVWLYVKLVPYGLGIVTSPFWLIYQGHSPCVWPGQRRTLCFYLGLLFLHFRQSPIQFIRLFSHTKPIQSSVQIRWMRMQKCVFLRRRWWWWYYTREEDRQLHRRRSKLDQVCLCGNEIGFLRFYLINGEHLSISHSNSREKWLFVVDLLPDSPVPLETYIGFLYNATIFTSFFNYLPCYGKW